MAEDAARAYDRADGGSEGSERSPRLRVVCIINKGKLKVSLEESADSESALNTLASRRDTTRHRLQPPHPPKTQPQMKISSASNNPTTGITQAKQLDAKPTPPKVY
ncbi:Uncharacterized protein Fot_03675 [Forsythia ovata]|uniref:Uncharacterized protein n=1 Tax=Forsythia ovata TaxID=205694 RepID=A0ABD1XB05_9LAMI